MRLVADASPLVQITVAVLLSIIGWAIVYLTLHQVRRSIRHRRVRRYLAQQHAAAYRERRRRGPHHVA